MAEDTQPCSPEDVAWQHSVGPSDDMSHGLNVDQHPVRIDGVPSLACISGESDQGLRSPSASFNSNKDISSSQRPSNEAARDDSGSTIEMLKRMLENNIRLAHDPQEDDAHRMSASKSGYESTGTMDCISMIVKFATMLFNDVTKDMSGFTEAETLFSHNVEDLLADFALRLGHATPHTALKYTMLLVDKHRSHICTYLTQRMHKSLNFPERNQPSFGEPPALVIQKLLRWSVSWDSDLSINGGNDESLTGMEGLYAYDAQGHETLISASPEYRWLIASIRNESLLTSSNQEIIAPIRREVYRYVIDSDPLSRSTIVMKPTEARFEMAANFAGSLLALSEKELDSILTITGSPQDAQALTCRQYLMQTWPSDGMRLWQLVKGSLLHPGQRISCDSTTGEAAWAQVLDAKLTVGVFGSSGILADAAEQLCWISCVVTAPTPTSDHLHNLMMLHSPSLKLLSIDLGPAATSAISTASSHPSPKHGDTSMAHRQSGSSCVRCKRRHLKCDGLRPFCTNCRSFDVVCRWKSGATMESRTSDQRSAAEELSSAPEPDHRRYVVSFEIELRSQSSTTSWERGTCWHRLFRRCTIVHGFPIRRRSREGLGLEMSLGLMSRLMAVGYIHRFDQRLFLKQHSIMLTPTALLGDLLVWHVCQNLNGERISYLEHGLRGGGEGMVSYDNLPGLRHIVGWCTNVNHIAGHRTADYHVETSGLEQSPQTGSLHDCVLSFGRPVAGRTTFCFTLNIEPAMQPKRNYLNMFRFLERRSVLFWDVDTKRGWLVNGLRAALHMLRQSLSIDLQEDTGGIFVLQPGDLVEPDSPYDAKAARQFLSNLDNLSAKLAISNIGFYEHEYETLSERFERFYDVLEQAFDHQSKPRKWKEISRSFLEGWDFAHVARKDDLVPSSIYSMPPVGRGWIDFIRATNTITLMGAGFGDLLQCASSSCEPVPVDSYYLAVSVSDLPETALARHRRTTGNRRILCRSPAVILHSPQGSSTIPDCLTRMYGDSSASHQYVQVMWPAEHESLLPPAEDPFELENRSNGALVFGHHKSLDHYIPNLGSVPLPGHPPDADQNLDFIDSGMGTSQASMQELSSEASRSTMSPFGESESSPEYIKSQNHSYGGTSMVGGYGIFGNISGNLSVTQYFGFEDKKFTRSQSQCAVAATSSQSSKQVQNPGLPHAIPPERSVAAADNDSIDVEFEEGQNEIQSLGLEDYCSIFRLS